MADQHELIPNLFRSEYGKIVAVLGRLLGFGSLGLAEDIASETFVAAMQSWAQGNLPDNPAAWLYAVAKNKAANELTRRSIAERKLGVLGLAVEQVSALEPNFSESNSLDSLASMMFVLCDDSLSVETQIVLNLKLLCGFSVQEIADAVLSTPNTIHKRLARGKARLRKKNLDLVLPPPNILPKRLGSVLHTLYLMFNEGAFSSTGEVIRPDLCLQAMSLAKALAEHPETRDPRVDALIALMCFHAARFDARTTLGGAVVGFEEQDKTLWDTELIDVGRRYLAGSARGDVLSRYHFEAAIAYWQITSDGFSSERHRWEQILNLYDRLIDGEVSPVVALNRIYAFAKVHGNEAALRELSRLPRQPTLLTEALHGYLLTEIDRGQAIAHYRRAIAAARNDHVRVFLAKRLHALETRLLDTGTQKPKA